MLTQEYVKPANLSEALEFLAKHGKAARPLAGGTDLLILLKDGVLTADYILDIKDLPETRALVFDGEGLTVGAGVCLNDLIALPLPASYDPLKMSAKLLANSLLRNRATLAGNIVNASPGGDMLPASLVLKGSVLLASAGGERCVPLKGFFTGVKKTVLKDDELLVKAVFPKLEGRGVYYKKQRIKGHDLSQVGVAAFLESTGDLRVALSSVAPMPLLFDDLGSFTPASLGREKDGLTERIVAELRPISDQRATMDYRFDMARLFLNRAFSELSGEV